MEDAITNITNNGYVNLIEQFVGARAYSYVFSGEASYLDHALASSDLTNKVTGVTEWHINADEPRALDYNTEYKSENQQTSFYAADPYRMSDHDPVIIGFEFSQAAMLGDFDNDQDVDRYDIFGLMRAIQFGYEIDPAFDLNNDGNFNIMDARVMFTLCTNPRCLSN